jgi:hypothetical protein
MLRVKPEPYQQLCRGSAETRRQKRGIYFGLERVFF